jgi:hypothetical protein
MLILLNGVSSMPLKSVPKKKKDYNKMHECCKDNSTRQLLMSRWYS